MSSDGGRGDNKDVGGQVRGQDQELPVKSSPYVQHEDLEDYKRRGYGTEGHQLPVDRGGGGTEGPTLSGSGLPRDGRSAGKNVIGGDRK